MNLRYGAFLPIITGGFGNPVLVLELFLSCRALLFYKLYISFDFC